MPETGKIEVTVEKKDEKKLDKKFIEYGDRLINLYAVNSIDKIFEIPDNGGELDRYAFEPKYGIVINKNSFANEIKVFYQTYELREQSYIEMLNALKNLGAEITIL